jgi:hypothetical protein
MNAYQQKWIQVLRSAGLHDWRIEPFGEDIEIEMPNITDLKLIRDNLPEVIGSLSLDIDVPKERLQFIFRNGRENFEYLLNPTEEDLTTHH